MAEILCSIPHESPVEQAAFPAISEYPIPEHEAHDVWAAAAWNLVDGHKTHDVCVVRVWNLPPGQSVHGSAPAEAPNRPVMQTADSTVATSANSARIILKVRSPFTQSSLPTPC